jgi:hypothetical protein
MPRSPGRCRPRSGLRRGVSGVPRSRRRQRSIEAKPAAAASVATATGTPITVTSSAAASDRPLTSTVKESSAAGSARRMKVVSRPRRLSTPGTDAQRDTATGTGTGTTVAPGSTAETGAGGIVGFTFISSSLVSDAGPVDPVSMPLEGSASPPRAPSPSPRSAARQLRPTESVCRPREHPQHAAEQSG